MKKGTATAPRASEGAPDSWLDAVAAVPLVGIQLVPDWGLRLPEQAEAVLATDFTGPASGTASLVAAPPVADARALARGLLGPMESDLRAKRSALALRKVTTGLSAADDRALEYLSWQLDRIEDAHAGEGLDALERLVLENEKLGEAVGSVIAALHESGRTSKPRRRPRRR